MLRYVPTYGIDYSDYTMVKVCEPLQSLSVHNRLLADKKKFSRWGNLFVVVYRLPVRFSYNVTFCFCHQKHYLILVGFTSSLGTVFHYFFTRVMRLLEVGLNRPHVFLLSERLLHQLMTCTERIGNKLFRNLRICFPA